MILQTTKALWRAMAVSIAIKIRSWASEELYSIQVVNVKNTIDLLGGLTYCISLILNSEKV